MAQFMILLIKPLSLVKFTCFFGVRTICIVVQTWTELLRAAMSFHASILWRLIIWAIAILSLPIRSLTALQRERALEMHLQEMQIEFANLVWERKELEKKILIAIKEKKIIQAMLAELEDEHDEAIVKIEELEGQLKDLKVENQRLIEVHGKALSDRKDHFDAQVMQGCSDSVPFWKSSGIESVDIDKSKSGSMNPDFMGARSYQDVKPCARATSEDFEMSDVLHQQRDLAVFRTLFSAILSLLVGTIVWKAEDACMPLVLALFAVVGMSLWSVVQFFSTIKNTPASDAVALLSFNWVLLGTLTYPTLPRITPVFAPALWTLSDRTVELLGF
ncbi:putative benzyl alcohol O-benzoyltransferase [Capsicum annuum]|nr:putative benzyl alcohol O-benzoyltransferase [Capsicum annuum]